MRRRASLAAAVLLAGGAAAEAGGAPRDFPFFKALAPSVTSRHEMAAFALDDELYARLDAGFDNLRVFDDQGAEVPFVCQPRAERRVEVRDRRVPTAVASLRELPDNRIEVIVERKAKEGAPAVAEFVTQARDFEKQVTISGSADRTNWTVLAEASPVFDYSRYMDVRNCRVAIAPKPFAWYRIEISRISESYRSPWAEISKDRRGRTTVSESEKVVLWTENLRIDDVRFFERREEVVERREARREYPARIEETAVDPEKRLSRVTVRTARQPLLSLTVEAPDPVFSRSVTVEATEDAEGKGGWTAIASSTITRLHAGPTHQETRSIALPAPSRHPFYRLLIRNEDSPPLTVSGVLATGLVHEVAFFPKPQAAYSAYYGGAERPAPSYDLRRVTAGLQAADRDVWTAGPETANPGASPAGRAPLSPRALMVAAVVLMVLVLGWLVLKAARNVPAGG